MSELPAYLAISSIREFCKDYGLTANDALEVWNQGLASIAAKKRDAVPAWVGIWATLSEVSPAID